MFDLAIVDMMENERKALNDLMNTSEDVIVMAGSSDHQETRNEIKRLETDLQVARLTYEREIKEKDNALKHEAVTYQRQLRQLELELHRLSEENSRLKRDTNLAQETFPPLPDTVEPIQRLSAGDIERYSRQLLLQDGFGVEGQYKLLSSSVLVVGAGGIGSTALLYLAASGVGRISVADFDDVDMSNLHRQVIHKEANVGINKAISACQAVISLNPTITCAALEVALTHANALDIISRHDIIVDASDNPRTRYLINDACVLSGKPLVSGSAMGTEGQLTVYNHSGGPCYRCLYPKPNAAEGCKSCSDNGVLGPVPGLIGILQSLEVIKILTGVGTTMHDRMLMYDSLSCSFITIKKPPKSKKCPICSDATTIASMEDSVEVCRMARGPQGIAEQGANAPMHIPSPIANDLHVSCRDYKQVRDLSAPHILLDVRAQRQFEMCSLEGATNIPLSSLSESLGEIEALGSKPIYCICRRGIFSMEATRILTEAMVLGLKIHSVKNILGGYTAWAEEVDSTFPKY